MKTLEPTWKLSKKEIEKNFDFLVSDFGFPKFKKKWIKDEHNIFTRKGDIEFSVCIFESDWNAPIIGIVNHSEPIEFKAEMFPTNHYQIDELDRTSELKKMRLSGRDFVEVYITECAKLLKSNPKILDGINSDFKTE